MSKLKKPKDVSKKIKPRTKADSVDAKLATATELLLKQIEDRQSTDSGN